MIYGLIFFVIMGLQILAFFRATVLAKGQSENKDAVILFDPFGAFIGGIIFYFIVFSALNFGLHIIAAPISIGVERDDVLQIVSKYVGGFADLASLSGLYQVVKLFDPYASVKLREVRIQNVINNVSIDGRMAGAGYLLASGIFLTLALAGKLPSILWFV